MEIRHGPASPAQQSICGTIAHIHQRGIEPAAACQADRRVRKRSAVSDLLDRSAEIIGKVGRVAGYEKLFRPESHRAHAVRVDAIIALQQDLQALARHESQLPRIHVLRRTVEQIDAAEKGSHESAPRLFVERSRGVELCNLALVHDGDVVRHCHRFLLIVGDEDERGADGPLNGDQLALHLGAQTPIQRGHRLIQQQDRRLHHQASRQRNALTLARRTIGPAADRPNLRAVRARGPTPPGACARTLRPRGP